MLTTVISGGQTGTDIAGLKAATQCGLKTGGWMPKGFKTLDGPRPEYAEIYDIKEHQNSGYPARTALNVKESDGTIRFASNFNSPGEILTAKFIRQYNKPSISIDIRLQVTSPNDVALWIITNKIAILNVAGNSDKTSPGIEEFVVKFLTTTFSILKAVSIIDKWAT